MYKIIISNGYIKYAFDQDLELIFLQDRILTPDFVIGDLNSGNSILIENIESVPEDFECDLYIYQDGEFIYNE